jgi:hypothetical protein
MCVWLTGADQVAVHQALVMYKDKCELDVDRQHVESLIRKLEWRQ